MLEVVQTMASRGLAPPLLLRFPDILAHRLRQLQVCQPHNTHSQQAGTHKIQRSESGLNDLSRFA